MRRLFTISTAISLMLALLTFAAWALSFARSDRIMVAWGPHRDPGGYDDATGVVWPRSVTHPSFGILSNRGLLHIGTGWGDWIGWNREFEVVFKPGETMPESGRPFEFSTKRRLRSFPNVPMLEATFPDAVPLAVFSVFPLAWWVRLRRRRSGMSRLTTRQCTRCGYDLRASTQRCPECGTPITPATRTAPNPPTVRLRG